MKFAVVEYSSKTGRIWRHTPERPNYLCDPDKEIDPTSFGCYVSALEGVHIPLTSYIVGANSGVWPINVLLRKVIKRLTGSWPGDYSIADLGTYDVLMIVHQISDGHEITALTKRMKKEYPNVLIMGVPTQPYGLLTEYWEKHPEAIADMKEFMNACDLFITITASTKSIWQSMTTAPVEYLAQPYPVEYAQAAFKPLSEKSNVIYVAGVTSRPHITRGQEVAVALQKKFPALMIEMTDTPDINVDALKGSKYMLAPFKPWREQLDYLASVKLVINTDFTQTRGRVQMDCAVVGTPSLGSDSDAQVDLFPDLAATPATSVTDLIAQGEKLLTQDSWYESLVKDAQGKLPKYNYQESAKRLQDLTKKRPHKDETL